MDEEKLCARCGLRWIASNPRHNKIELCSSCRAKRHKIVRYGEQVCIPHHGDFDEQDNPMESGILVLPGLRVCGHRDCVNTEHIISDF